MPVTPVPMTGTQKASDCWTSRNSKLLVQTESLSLGNKVKVMKKDAQHPSHVYSWVLKHTPVDSTQGSRNAHIKMGR